MATTKITEQNISNLANLGVQWQAVITADGVTTTTGVAGRGYFIDTTSFTHSFNLPSSATAGDTIIVKDYAKTFDTNKLTVSGNGNNIEGQNSTADITTEGQSTTFVYVDSTKGWVIANEGKSSNVVLPTFIAATGGTVLTNGDYKTHVFTGDGCFVVSSLGAGGGSTTVEYVVVAGGGSGAGIAYTGAGAGGGGAGGYRQNFPSPIIAGFPVTATTFPITVGAGGVSATGGNGTSGSNSVFSTITSTGGGRGATQPGTGANGGSGGGGTWQGLGGGSGNTPPTSPSQGNNGGAGSGPAPVPGLPGGGGGGASVAGGPGANPDFNGRGGKGGNGSSIPDSFFGPTAPTYGTPGPAPGRYFAGGGAGGANGAPSCFQGPGGAGGGGTGGYGQNSGNRAGGTGTANTGGGGGGSGSGPTPNTPGGAGGKGIVLIRYKYQ